MTRKAVLVLLVLALAAAPVFAQFRLEVGAVAPLGGGYFDSAHQFHNEEDIFGGKIFPVPELGLSFRIPLFGFMRLGVGIRAFSAIIQTVAFPTIYTEAMLGPLVLEAQLGGLAFASFGTLGSSFHTGVKVLIPDISAWLALGKKGIIRIGGGVIGIGGTDLIDTGFPVLYYAGAKIVLNP